MFEDYSDKDVSLVKSIALTLTHNCNLHCTYCYEKHSEHKRMTVETAKKIIDTELRAEDGTQYVSLEFFGGEPLLEFELIREVVEYCKKQNYSKEYQFEISTNGTLLTDEMKTWFKSNEDLVGLGLSLDGTRESHNINRSNSFDMIDLDFFSNYYTNQVKMTISEATLPHLYENVVFCHKKGFQVACNLAYGIDWSKESNFTTYAEQLNKLIEFYIENPCYPICSCLDPDKMVGVGEGDPIQRTCGAGWAMKAYDCDGTFYPCQFFMPLSAGEEKAAASHNLVFFKNPAEDENFSEECRQCPFVNSCAHCYGSNYVETGNMYEFEHIRCKLVMLEFKAIAYFVSRMFELGMLNEDYELTPSIIKGAVNTEHYFRNQQQFP